MAPSSVRIPIYMRLGGGAEIEVGDVELPVSGDGTLTMRRSQLAAALRSAADNLDNPALDETPGAG